MKIQEAGAGTHEDDSKVDDTARMASQLLGIDVEIVN